MKVRNIFSVAVAIGTLIGTNVAFAAKDAKSAEAAMMKACKKDYPDAVKGKSAKEVADWVETEESGANATTFKKSKCYAQHETWESAAGKNEAGEEHEKK